MVLAHALGGSGGPEIEILVLGVALVVVGFMMRGKENVKPAFPIGAIVAGLGLVIASFLLPAGSSTTQAASDVAVTIAFPQDGDTVPASEAFDVEVELDGATLTEDTTGTDPRKGHIHVFVDGELLSMPTSLQSPVTLEPGSHEITVEFVAADHTQFEPRILNTIEVTAE
ncbi:MAG: hypothetical protein ACRDLB_09660 [Actinomycetota bacterium]